MHAHIDIETFSEQKLKSGMYRYAEHESTEILCVCYSFDGGPVSLWVPYAEDLIPEAIPHRIDGDIHFGLECPFDLSDYVESGGECRAWNAQFERTLLNGHAGKRIGFPETKITQWVCVAAKGAAHSIPRALGNAAKAVGTHPKDETGKNVMMSLCKPRTGEVLRYSMDDKKEGAGRYRELFDYCGDDVRAERDIDVYLPDLSPREQNAFWLDQVINERGVRVDEPRVTDAIHLVKDYRARLKEKCQEMTGLSPTQTDKLATWIRAHGYDIENLQAPTIKLALVNSECPDEIKKVLRLRSIYAMKAVDKYVAIENAVCSDGRLHGMFLYHGAGTGRWSSLIVQLQNLFRPVIKDPDDAIEAFVLRNIEWINDLWDKNPMQVLASCVRGMLIPAEGRSLLCLDYSQIEARVIAWLAGQEDLLDVFRSGIDVYKHAAAGIYGVAVDDVTDDQRFIGKIAILALGYQGGKVAFAKMAKNYGVDIEEAFAEKIKCDWRDANPKIVRLWYNLEEAACAAVANPGKVYGVSGKKIMFKVEGEFLYMRLPSGRRLAYLRPQLDGNGQVTYMGIDTYTRQWKRCKTYGGKLAENAVQAIARDILLNGMFALEEAGYPIIGTVHDEAIMEIVEITDENEKKCKLKEVAALMCKLEDCHEGIPVKAEGFIEQRYRK